MKITELELFKVAPRWLFLKISTDEGISGWGEPIVEGRADTTAAAVRELATYLIGQDPTRIEDLCQVLFKGGFYRGGPVMCSAWSGIEHALWDIKGKRHGLPVYEFFGGPVRDAVRVYTWIAGDQPGTLALDQLRDQARQAARMGFTGLKMNVVGPQGYLISNADLARAVRRVEAVRDAVGDDMDIGIDFHGRVHKAAAKQLLRELEPTRPMFVEEPVLPEHGDLFRELADSTTIPLAAGERLFTRWDFKTVLEQRALAIIQPDLSHAGGIWEGRKIAAMAEAYDVAVAPHNPLGPITYAASLQLDACMPNFFIQEQSAGIHYNQAADLFDYVVDPLVFALHDGMVAVPQGPGLGVEINEDAVRRAAGKGHDFKSPIWRLADGTFAEW